jgi:hypothetical protein
MKKCIVLAVLAAFGLTFAQEQKTISFGARVGLNLNSAKFIAVEESDIQTLPYILDNHYGFHAGVVADIAINQFLYFQPGVMLSTKGGVINEEYEYTDRYQDNYEHRYSKRTYTISVYCIELPLMLSLKAPLAEDLFLRVNAGPYLDIGISGTFKEEWDYNYERRSSWGNSYDEDSDEESQDIYPSKKKRGINGESFNAGIGVGGGIEFKSFYIGLNYYYGLSNVLQVNGDDAFEAYDRTLGITLGYNF